MAINTEALEKALMLESGVLSAAINSDENVDIDISGLKIMKTSDYDNLKSNHEKELEDKKVFSNKVGREEALKEIVRPFLPEDFEGRKDPSKIIEAIKALKMKEFNIDPNEQLTEALKKVEAYENVLSQKDKEILIQKELYEKTVNDHKQETDMSFIDQSLQKEFAKYSDKATLGQEDVLSLYKLRRELKVDGDSVQLYNGDELVKDEFRNAKQLSDDFSEFMSTSYIKKPKGGRGGETETTGGKMTVEKFQKSYMSSNPSATTEDINRALIEKMSNNEIES